MKKITFASIVGREVKAMNSGTVDKPKELAASFLTQVSGGTLDETAVPEEGFMSFRSGGSFSSFISQG